MMRLYFGFEFLITIPYAVLPKKKPGNARLSNHYTKTTLVGAKRMFVLLAVGLSATHLSHNFIGKILNFFLDSFANF